MKAASSGLRKTPGAQDCPMRTLAIGDIHGCSTALRTVLEAVQPGADDILVTLGDYVDRGPDSKGVLDTLIGLEKTTQLIPLTGNHEILFLEAMFERLNLGAWESIGGLQTLRSYCGDETLSWNHIPEAHIEFITRRCRRLHETDAHIFVHANLNAMLPLDEQTDDWLYWTRFSDSHPHFSGKTMICGHTAQHSGLPVVRPGGICLDTWVYNPAGWLTCMDVDSGEFTQANERGELRTLSLNALEMTTLKMD